MVVIPNVSVPLQKLTAGVGVVYLASRVLYALGYYTGGKHLVSLSQIVKVVMVMMMMERMMMMVVRRMKLVILVVVAIV